MIPSHFPAALWLNHTLQEKWRPRDWLCVHPCEVPYNPGDLPPWLSLLRACNKLLVSHWYPDMTALASDARAGHDEAFLADWFKGDALASRALVLARRLLPDHFAPEGQAALYAQTEQALGPAEQLELALLRGALDLSVADPSVVHCTEALTLMVLLVGHEGVPCQLTLRRVELGLKLRDAHACVVRAPGAALLELDADFLAGLAQVQGLLQRVLQPAGGASGHAGQAIAWRLRALDRLDGSGNPVPQYLRFVDGPSLTAALAVGSLFLLRDHLAEPWKRQWHQTLRELKMKRFCATAALAGYHLPAPHGFDEVLDDPLGWRLEQVGGVPLKFDALAHARPNWSSPSSACVAEHQDVSGNQITAIKCPTLGSLILAAHKASEPLQLPEAYQELEAALVAGEGEQPMPQALLDAVHAAAWPRWQQADQSPTDAEAEKVLRVWWLKRYAHWASGHYQAFGPLRGGQTDEPVALTEHFHPIDIDPEPQREQRPSADSPTDDEQRRALRADGLPELFRKCPNDAAFRLHAQPAGGKTTLLAHHELHTAQAALREHLRSGQWGELALWLPLRDYPARLATDPLAAVDGLWARVQTLYPDLGWVLRAWQRGQLNLPGLRLRWLCDAVNEIPADSEDQRRQAQGALYRGLIEQGSAHAWLPPVFTVRTHSQNQALAGARGCTLLTWDGPSRLRYMEKRLGADTPAFHTLSAAINADPRDDRDKFFATPGHLAAQCTLMQAGIVSEPARNRAQLFCTLLWLRLAQEQQRGQLPGGLLSDDESDKIDRLHTALAQPGGWRWPRRLGPLMQALATMAVYQQHLDPASRARQRQAGEGERLWSMTAPRDWLLQPPNAKPMPATEGAQEGPLIRAVQHLNLLHKDADGEQLTWTHQLWLELFAALGLNPGDPSSEWLDTPAPVLPEMEDLWEQHKAAGRSREKFRIPTVPPLAEEETLRYLIQLRGDVVNVVQRVLGAGNAPLAARLALDNWVAFGEPAYPEQDPQGPWRPERQGGEVGGTHPVLNAIRQALHIRMYSDAVHIAQRIEAGDLLGALGGSPLFDICGHALVLRDEHWVPIGRAGEPYRFEMGDLEGRQSERTADGQLLSVSLPPFQIAGHLVTNAQYRCFVHSGSFGDAAWWPGEAGVWWANNREDRRQPLTLSQTDAEGQGKGLEPVTANFWQAQAYALWEQAQRERAGRIPGLRLQLPTEAQWEGAARWPRACQMRDQAHQAGERVSDVRWRFAHTAGAPLQASVGPDADAEEGSEAGFADVKPWYFNHDHVIGMRTSPLGVFLHSQASHEGRALHDLAGNVWEWCASPFETAEGKALLGPQVDRVATGTESRALRGGGYFVTAAYCRAGNRDHDAPVTFVNILGFRLVLAAVL